MDLKTKLQTLNIPQIQPIKSGFNKTIEEFWNEFVLPMLPSKEIMERWLNLLLRYVQDDNIVFAVRCFRDWEKKDGKNDNYSLRGGFLNTTDNKYSLFYTDNFFATYFEKMALDGYVPEYEDFKSTMLSRDFPARHGRHCKEEKAKAAYSIDGKKAKDPQFQIKGYKIAHIVDTGKYFAAEDEFFTGIKSICNTYCPRGKYDDWQPNSDGVYVRHLGKLPDKAKKLFAAHFLRFACPLNYVLTPQKKYHSTNIPVQQNDIAEHTPFQRFAMKKFLEKYGDIYKKYLENIMLPDFIHAEDTGNEIIDIKYGIEEALKTNTTKKTMTTTPIKSSNHTPGPKDFVISKCQEKGYTIYTKNHYSSLKDRAVFWINIKLNEFDDNLTLICHNEHKDEIHIINIPAHDLTTEQIKKIRIKTNKAGSLFDLQIDPYNFTDKYSGVSFKKYVTTFKL